MRAYAPVLLSLLLGMESFAYEAMECRRDMRSILDAPPLLKGGDGPSMHRAPKEQTYLVQPRGSSEIQRLGLVGTSGNKAPIFREEMDGVVFVDGGGHVIITGQENIYAWRGDRIPPPVEGGL